MPDKSMRLRYLHKVSLFSFSSSFDDLQRLSEVGEYHGN